MLPRTRCLRALLRRPTLTMPLRSRILAPPPQSFSTAAAAADDPDDVLFTSALGVRTIELNRPAKLNALNGSMVRKIIPRLQEWEKSHLANLIILKGSGPRSLCAGGDVQALSALCKRGPTGAAEAAAYFGLEYQLDHLVATYAKPFVALMDGVTMGGGVGLSVHAPFRIATERTLFAMPETRIGFFPDVGGSFFLPRLDGSVGTYLALTSERLKGVQTLYAGIATHYLHSSSLPDLEQRLSELTFDDHATHSERCRIIDSTIEEFNTGLPDEPIQLSGDLRSSIDHCFSHNTLPEILSTLSTLSTTGAGNPWADHTLTTLRSRSPTSLLVTLRLMRLGLGPDWTITESFQREHSVATRFMSHPDFVSGVDAVLGGADPPVEPVWTPGTVEETTEELAVRFVTPGEGETRLQMLGRAGRDYAAYPYSWGLPSEGEIRAVAEGRKMVVADLVRAVVDGRGGKEGVERKVWDVVGRKMEVVEGFVRWRE